MLAEAHLDQVAAAADALQDVLDVVRERGDGLPDGRQPLGLDHRRVVAGVFDGERGLVPDGDHQLQVVLGEFRRAALLDHLLRRGRGVDVDRADHVVAALHRHADRLADAHLQDAAGRVPAVVEPGVARDHAFVLLDHVVEDRLADVDFVVVLDALPRAPHAGLERLRWRGPSASRSRGRPRPTRKSTP